VRSNRVAGRREGVMERVQCPHCKKRVTFKSSSDLPFFPFCCERCKMADLGMWFREEHGIPGPKEKPDDGPKTSGGPKPRTRKPNL